MLSTWRLLIQKGCLWAVVVLMLSCVQNRSKARLVAYVEAERTLRQRIHDEQILNDSLLALRHEFDINLERDLEKISKNPKDWIFLFDSLEDTQ